jgi:hypothetical protein
LLSDELYSAPYINFGADRLEELFEELGELEEVRALTRKKLWRTPFRRR